MTDFQTDEEKAEAIKDWWKENGTSVTTGIVLAVAGLFGYQYWQDHTRTQSEQASAIYSQILSEDTKQEDVKPLTDTLKNDFSSTPYAALSAMINAKLLAEKGNNTQAAEELRWAIDNAKSNGTSNIAKIHLTRVLLALKELDKANEIISQEFPSAYQSLIEELKGDYHLAKNEINAARDAYDKALLSSRGMSTEFLKMKRDNLGEGV